MQYRLRRHEKEAVRREFGEDILFRAILTPCRSYEAEARGFCIAAEEVFLEVMSVLDNTKENPAEALFNVRGLWDELIVDYRDLATDNIPDDDIKACVSEVMTVLALYFQESATSLCNTLAAEFMRQLVAHGAPTTDMVERFCSNFVRLGNNVVGEAVRAYMKSDVFLSNDMNDMLQALPEPRIKACDANHETKKGKGVEQLTNRQLMILFDLFLNKGFKPEYCNQNALAKLLSRVSGNSEGSIRQKIREGVDYDVEEVKNDVRLLAELLRPIDVNLAEKMKNLIE